MRTMNTEDRSASAVYRFFQRIFFPAVLFGAPTAVYVLLERGASVPVATYSVIVVLGLLFLAAEWLMPYRRGWNRPQGDLKNDIISGTVAYGILPIFLKPLYVAMLAGATAWVSARAGGSLWPSDWPMAAQVILLLLAGDAGRYWGHRLAHEIPFLWRFHAVHHSARRLWWWNATRQHPVDKAWFTFTELFFPILLGVDGTVVALYLGVTAVCGYSQHCNIDLKLGPFYWFFNVVELHRWHHSKEIAESDNNYGNNLIIYDRIFGTCYHPEQQEKSSRQVGDIGLLNPDYPQHYLGQLMAPFTKGLDKVQQTTLEREKMSGVEEGGFE
ncbi:MAG: sterol desaturase family protein [Pseudomonadota bacterium]